MPRTIPETQKSNGSVYEGHRLHFSSYAHSYFLTIFVAIEEDLPGTARGVHMEDIRLGNRREPTTDVILLHLSRISSRGYQATPFRSSPFHDDAVIEDDPRLKQQQKEHHEHRQGKSRLHRGLTALFSQRPEPPHQKQKRSVMPVRDDCKQWEAEGTA